MPELQISTTITTNANNLEEVNHELSRLKATIGLIVAKLPPESREHFMKELAQFGLDREVELYTHFSPK